MFPWGNNQYPFNQNIKELLGQVGHQKDIDSYVQNVIGKSLQNISPNMPFDNEDLAKTFDFLQNENKRSEKQETQTGPFPYHVFESHDDVFVQIPIQDKSVLKNIKIYHTSNKSIIEGIPTKEDKQEIILPALVKKKGAHATYKDGTLEIKIPKNIDMQFSEIDVEEK